MRLAFLLAGGLLLGVPGVSLAQVTEPASLPRYYAGLAAYSSNYQRLGISAYTNGLAFPVQATFGYQYRPRLAAQLGLAYLGLSNAYSYTDRDYLPNGRRGPLYESSFGDWLRTASLALLGRYTLTRKAAHRVQFDLLAGVTAELQRNSSRYTRTDSAAAPVTTEQANFYGTLLITAGPGIRYRFGPRFEATYNWLYTFNILSLTSAYRPSYALNGNVALGVQYRFGRR